MTLNFIATVHGTQRLLDRGISTERVNRVLNNHSWSAPGNSPGTKRFVGDEPPPPVGVVTTWPPDATDTVKVITAYVIPRSK